MDDLSVDVILTTYNGRRWVGDAIDSVLAQTYPRWHLTVIDDASPQYESRYIEATYGSDERLTVVRLDQNQQVTGARIEAISRTSAEVITFIDQDDRWHPAKLALQVRRFQEQPGVHVVHTDVRHIDEHGHVLSGSADWENQRRASVSFDSIDSGQLARILFLHNSLRIVSAAILRNAYDRVGGFDQTLWTAADWELWVRLAAAGYHFSHLPMALVDRRIHSGQVTRLYHLWLPEKRVLATDKIAMAYPELADLADRRRVDFLRQAVVWALLTGDGGRARAAIHRLTRLRGWTVKSATAWTLAWLGPLARPLVRAFLARRPDRSMTPEG